jgi:uncharacterized membrane protein (DUF2068 family)
MDRSGGAIIAFRSMRASTGLRAAAVFECVKGVVVLAAGCGAVALVHRDLQAIAEEMVASLHLNPASRYPQIFLDAAQSLTDARLWTLAAMAFAYAALRLAEGWGLWWERRWAEWLAVVSGGIYIPIEVYEVARRPTLIHLVLTLGNVGVVAFVARQLRSVPARQRADRG